METISNALGRAGNYLTTIGISDFIDILIVAFLIYRVIWFVRRSNFGNLAKGVLLLLLALWLCGGKHGLRDYIALGFAAHFVMILISRIFLRGDSGKNADLGIERYLAVYSVVNVLFLIVLVGLSWIIE